MGPIKFANRRFGLGMLSCCLLKGGFSERWELGIYPATLRAFVQDALMSRVPAVLLIIYEGTA